LKEVEEEQKKRRRRKKKIMITLLLLMMMMTAMIKLKNPNLQASERKLEQQQIYMWNGINGIW
jgi:hypothetical protein